MASPSVKKRLLALAPEPNPKAELDSPLFLAAAAPVLKQLFDDLLKRADASPALTRALKARHAEEKKAERTADGFPQWRRHFVDQVAAAWLLSCVFVRTLEDRGLVEQARLAGPGALDSERQFRQLAPSLTERDYLLLVFGELSHFPAAKDLFDQRHNPVWLLAPSAEAAKALLDLFRAASPEAPAFRFGQEDSRFLGDLYQDLNEGVKARFALLQTPRFVERFILERTLDPAIERFGLEETSLIDPTCGSGHFLLGAFEKLLDAWLVAQPNLDVRQAAAKALGQVYGSDINPYAVAIARLRLTLAFLERAKFTRLRDAPELALNLVVADSLLYNPQLEQTEFAHLESEDDGRWNKDVLSLSDPKAARKVLHRQYTAVVGNPPYITVKDATLRDRYRAMYVSTFREYSLAAPFAERFFQLARKEGFAGMITANSFMKREFGKKLIQDYLPTVNLSLIVNTAGAYIPGHGTPTVLLFGTHSAPTGNEVDVVLGNRGEPSTPDDPEQGEVWSSIAQHWDEQGFENDYISVATVEREHLAKHPWSLGGGGAAELKALIEERAECTLEDLGVDIGTGAVTREDSVYFLDDCTLDRWGIPASFRRPMVTGENVRDWSVQGDDQGLWPYDPSSLQPVSSRALAKALFAWKSILRKRVAFGKTQEERGLPWTAYSMFFDKRARTPLTITFAFVATHNHFVLDRGGKVFNRTAPIIKLPAEATEEDHLALLAYLNSSVACFWMKQVMMNKGATSHKGVLQGDVDKFRFEFDGTKLRQLPLMPKRHRDRLASIAAELSALAQVGSPEEYAKALRHSSCAEKFSQIDASAADAANRSVALQEEIDWLVYDAFEIWSYADAGLDRYPAGARPFVAEEVLAELEPRRKAIAQSPLLQLLEQSEHKRRWYRSLGKFSAGAVSTETIKSQVLLNHLGQLLEEALTASTAPVRAAVVTAPVEHVFHELRCLAPSVPSSGTVLEEDSMPYLAALRFTDTGLETYAQWEHTWELQRAEDRGESVQDIPVPPKYDQKSYRDANYWRLRGKLDVPKERFISYPGCESDTNSEPVYGWAGWNHEQRAAALAALYISRRDDEGWTEARLTPMLAGLLELLPWLRQWHSDVNPEFGQSAADEFGGFVEAECRKWGLTQADLRAWRPATKAERAASKRASSASKPKAPKPPKEPKPPKQPKAPRPKQPRGKPKAATPPGSLAD